MTKEEYEEEINLIREQNDVEFELYPMATEIIQPTLNNLSKRYVFARRKTGRGKIYYGLSSFPDVAILDKNFKNDIKEKIREEDWNKLIGCLEVKKLGSKLITKEEIERALFEEELSTEMGQLIGEILWYKKVVYTNGEEWRFIQISSYSEEIINRIIDIFNKRINSKNEYDWWDSLKDFRFEIKDSLKDELITKDCLKNWEHFENEIKCKIKWEYDN